MKKIRISHYETPNFSSHYINQKMYSVSLGNGVKKWFSNRKDAISYLADANRELNRRLSDLNHIYGFIFAEYRKYWYYMEGVYKNADREINKSFNQVNKAFDLAVERSHFENGNHFTFGHLNLIVKELNGVLLQIIEVLTERKHFAELRQVEIYSDMVNYIELQLTQVGQHFKPSDTKKPGE